MRGAAELCGVVLLTDGRDLASGEQREGHDRNFPELDFDKGARVRGRVAAGADGLESDRQAVERAGADQCGDVAGAAGVGGEATAHVEAALVLADLLPGADRFVREVLVEHAHARRRAARE